MAPTFAYWQFRGLSEQIRLLLKYAKVEFEDKRYKNRLDYSDTSTQWHAEKDTLGLDFPNLPYWIDGDVKLTQSLVILRYLGRKYGLYPKTESDLQRAELIEQQIGDVFGGFARTLFTAGVEKAREETNKNFPVQLKAISDFLGQHEYFAGESITYVDFRVFDALDMFTLWEPSCLDGLDNLKAFMKRVRDLPTIAEYLASGDQPDKVFGLNSPWKV